MPFVPSSQTTPWTWEMAKEDSTDNLCSKEMSGFVGMDPTICFHTHDTQTAKATPLCCPHFCYRYCRCCCSLSGLLQDSAVPVPMGAQTKPKREVSVQIAFGMVPSGFFRLESRDAKNGQRTNATFSSSHRLSEVESPLPAESAFQ